MSQPYKICPQCQQTAELSALSCPKCGHQYRTQFAATSTQTQVQNTPILNTATGCVAGSGLGIVLIVIGGLLSITGIGAVIGVPMIVIGIGCFIAGPIAGSKWKVVDGTCPYCSGKVQTFASNKALDCPECKQRILFRDGLFTRLN